MKTEDKKLYWVSADQCYRTIVGDRDEVHQEHEACDNPAFGPFATLEEAMEFGNDWLSSEKPAAAHEAKTGPGYITYSEFTVMKDEYDPDYIDPDDPDPDPTDSISVGGADNLTPELERAWDRARRGYYDWLDYEADGYAAVTFQQQ